MAILPSTLLGILPVGCLLSMRGTLSAETFLSVIVLSFGVMQPLITAFPTRTISRRPGCNMGRTNMTGSVTRSCGRSPQQRTE